MSKASRAARKLADRKRRRSLVVAAELEANAAERRAAREAQRAAHVASLPRPDWPPALGEVLQIADVLAADLVPDGYWDEVRRLRYQMPELPEEATDFEDPG